jgi:hypothetical protein
MKNQFRSVLVAVFAICAVKVSAQVPVLSSYPSASTVLFLDFDGQYVTGTSWNYNGPINCAASGLNTFQITEVFNRVAEDYRPFNINVTTDSTKYFSAPVNHRIRVIVTVTNGWYPGVGGVSFVGSFNFGDDTPCFVFTGPSALGYNPKYVAEAASHEAGHTLGLYHQAVYDSTCKKVSDYNSGTGSGEIGWAPIMGVGYYENMTLWNFGPNPYGCAQTQNDLQVITTQNGFTYRSDDYSNSFASSQSLSFTGDSTIISGIIEQNTDQDIFKLDMPTAAQLKLNAMPFNVGNNNSGSNLDMQLTIYNESQTQSSVYNPGNLLSAIVDTPLNAGTYYIKVEGKGNKYAPNYASLGSYSLKATIGSGTPLPLHRLELSGSIAGDQHNLSWLIEAEEKVAGQSIEVSTDGEHFNSLVSLPEGSRSYSYTPDASGNLLYRVHVTFDNGKEYYSNIISLRTGGETQKPKLLSNIIQQNKLSIMSPVAFRYQVVDMAGRTILQGQLAAGMNDLNTPVLKAGMYFIRFNNGQNQVTEKFVKE